MTELKDKILIKIDRLRYQWKELLCADLAARATRRFPRVAYWVTLTVGARNIADDEVVFDVPFMDVLNRQFHKTKDFAHGG